MAAQVQEGGGKNGTQNNFMICLLMWHALALKPSPETQNSHHIRWRRKDQEMEVVVGLPDSGSLKMGGGGGDSDADACRWTRRVNGGDFSARHQMAKKCHCGRACDRQTDRQTDR